jgi:hypothetical protein
MAGAGLGRAREHLCRQGRSKRDEPLCKPSYSRGEPAYRERDAQFDQSPMVSRDPTGRTRSFLGPPARRGDPQGRHETLSGVPRAPTRCLQTPTHDLDAAQVSWAHMRQGFDAMMTRFPKSLWNANNYAKFACVAKDKAAYRKIRPTLGQSLFMPAWPTNASPEVCDRALLNPR